MSDIKSVVGSRQFNNYQESIARPASYVGDPVVNKKLDLAKSGDKMKFLDSYGKILEDGFETKELDRFIGDVSKTASVRFTPNGQIIIDNVTLKMPDFSAERKAEYEKRLADVKDAACKERIIVSRFSYASTVLLWIFFIVFVIFAIGYLIYRLFNSTNDFE